MKGTKTEKFKILLRVFALALSVFSIVVLTVFVPAFVSFRPFQNSAGAFEYISTHPLLGLPIPFYVAGRTPRLYDILYYNHRIQLPLHLYFESPFRSGGSKIVVGRLLADFLILFIPLLVLFILRLKLREKLPVDRFNLRKFFKRALVIFTSSVMFVISTAFLYPRTLYKADLIGNYDSIRLGFPEKFVSIYVKSNSLKFPYHLMSKTILKALFDSHSCSYSLILFNAIVIFIILVLIYYVYWYPLLS